jgi:hypothetical protein
MFDVRWSDRIIRSKLGCIPGALRYDDRSLSAMDGTKLKHDCSEMIHGSARTNQRFHSARNGNYLLFPNERCIIASLLRINATAVFCPPETCETWHEC